MSPQTPLTFPADGRGRVRILSGRDLVGRAERLWSYGSRDSLRVRQHHYDGSHWAAELYGGPPRECGHCTDSWERHRHITEKVTAPTLVLLRRELRERLAEKGPWWTKGDRY
jgi:hypothetical protein